MLALASSPCRRTLTPGQWFLLPDPPPLSAQLAPPHLSSRGNRTHPPLAVGQVVNWTLGGPNVIGYGQVCSVGVPVPDQLEDGDTPIRSIGQSDDTARPNERSQWITDATFLFQTPTLSVIRNCERHDLNFTCVLCNVAVMESCGLTLRFLPHPAKTMCCRAASRCGR